MILIRLSGTADDYTPQRGRKGMVDTLTLPPGSVQNTEVEGDRVEPVTEHDIGLQKNITWMRSHDRKRTEEPN